jgi:hypothetical protein
MDTVTQRRVSPQAPSACPMCDESLLDGRRRLGYRTCTACAAALERARRRQPPAHNREQLRPRPIPREDPRSHPFAAVRAAEHTQRLDQWAERFIAVHDAHQRRR